MNSIQRRLTLLIVGGLLVLAVASGLGFYFFSRWIFTRQFDAALTSKALAIATLVEQDGPAKYEMEFTGENMPEFTSAASGQYFQVWLPTGQMLRRSPNLKESDLPIFSESSHDSVIRDLELPDGTKGRAIRLEFIPHTDDNTPALGSDGKAAPPATIVFARDRSDLDQALTSLLFITFIGAIGIPLLAAAVVFFGIRKGLRPVRDLAGEMQKIETPLMAKPLQLEQYPRELQPVALQLNNLMDRLNAAFVRERRFTMDASHELRTPLAEAAAALEVASKWPDDQALLVEANRDALQSVRHMEVLVTSLLALARGESELINVKEEQLDLGELIPSVWSRLRDKAEDRNITFKSEIETDNATVIADRILLTSVLHNLLDNAVDYSPPGSSIDVQLTEGEEEVQLTISNAMNTPLAPSDVSQIFEPFWRKNAARTSSDSLTTPAHTGLGLALANTLCTAMDINIKAHVESSGRFTMELGLPPVSRAAVMRVL